MTKDPIVLERELDESGGKGRLCDSVRLEAPSLAGHSRPVDGRTGHTRALELVAEAGVNIGGAELDTAERAARALVREEPFRETAWRLLMRVLAARGNRAEALKLYDELRALLREELGTAPSSATQALHSELPA